MSEKEHIWMPRLKQQLVDNKIGRREFIRHITLLGMPAPVRPTCGPAR